MVKPKKLNQESSGDDLPFPDITPNEGDRLTYRLKHESWPGCAFIALLVLCLLWNSTVFAFAGGLLNGDMGAGGWLFAIFLLPFFLIGLLLIALVLGMILDSVASVGVGALAFEISKHPVYSGEPCDVYVAPSGGVLRLRSLVLSVECQEKASYTQGTNTVSEEQTVFQQVLAEQNTLDAEYGGSQELIAKLQLPAGVMHSFVAAHNSIRWNLILKGRVLGFYTMSRNYPFLVLPKEPTMDVE